MKWLLRLYPSHWRRRYGEEFLSLLEERGVTFVDLLDIIMGAADARVRQARGWVRSLYAGWPGLSERTAWAWVVAGVAAAYLLANTDIAMRLLETVRTPEGKSAVALLATIAGLTLTILYVRLGLACLRLLQGIRRTLAEPGAPYSRYSGIRAVSRSCGEDKR